MASYVGQVSWFPAVQLLCAGGGLQVTAARTAWQVVVKCSNAVVVLFLLLPVHHHNLKLYTGARCDHASLALLLARQDVSAKWPAWCQCKVTVANCRM